MIRTKNWRKLTDAQVRDLLADPDADESLKDEIVRDGMEKVQAGWSAQEERRRRRWCLEDADTPVVSLLSQLRRGTKRRLRRLAD